MRIDPELVVSDPALTLKRGAVGPWAKSTSPYYDQTLDALARHFGFKTTVAWSALPAQARDVILFGTGKESVRFDYNDGLRSYSRTWSGATRRPRATPPARRSAAS
jgi:excinuclease ABC subunit A